MSRLRVVTTHVVAPLAPRQPDASPVEGSEVVLVPPGPSRNDFIEAFELVLALASTLWMAWMFWYRAYGLLPRLACLSCGVLACHWLAAIVRVLRLRTWVERRRAARIQADRQRRNDSIPPGAVAVALFLASRSAHAMPISNLFNGIVDIVSKDLGPGLLALGLIGAFLTMQVDSRTGLMKCVGAMVGGVGLIFVKPLVQLVIAISQ